MYEYKGYYFRFKDNEDVKERFIKNYEYFNNILEIPLKQPISYITAKGLANGKTLASLNKILDRYIASDEGKDKKGSHHKSVMFNNASKNTTTINNFIQKINKSYDYLEDVSDLINELNYNIIFYVEGLK